MGFVISSEITSGEISHMSRAGTARGDHPGHLGEARPIEVAADPQTDFRRADNKAEPPCRSRRWRGKPGVVPVEAEHLVDDDSVAWVLENLPGSRDLDRSLHFRMLLLEDKIGLRVL